MTKKTQQLSKTKVCQNLKTRLFDLLFVYETNLSKYCYV